MKHDVFKIRNGCVFQDELDGELQYHKIRTSRKKALIKSYISLCFTLQGDSLMDRLLSTPWMLPTVMFLRDRVTTTYRVSSIWLQKWCNFPDKAMKACDTMTLIYRLLSEPALVKTMRRNAFTLDVRARRRWCLNRCWWA